MRRFTRYRYTARRSFWSLISPFCDNSYITHDFTITTRLPYDDQKWGAQESCRSFCYKYTGHIKRAFSSSLVSTDCFKRTIYDLLCFQPDGYTRSLYMHTLQMASEGKRSLAIKAWTTTQRTSLCYHSCSGSTTAPDAITSRYIFSVMVMETKCYNSGHKVARFSSSFCMEKVLVHSLFQIAQS